MSEVQQRMKELVQKLNDAGRAYYQENREILSNFEYDRLYEELEHLEAQTGVVLSNSPTQRVGYEALDELEKEAHERPMLSLDKTKDREALRRFIGSRRTLLSWKLDGLTIVLTYRNGTLEKAVTRGNGLIGEVITNNARVFQNVPLRIPFAGRLVLRGEAVITYSDFERINAQIPDAEAKYKNPRNLCSGSVRQLNNEITAGRNVRFYAFTLVSAEGEDFADSREEQMKWLAAQGFETVEYRVVTDETFDAVMDNFEKRAGDNAIPSDGLVAVYDEISYGESLGNTSKFPRNAFAFKWADELRETTLERIEWSPSRTGLINPVAVFAPVELEGSTVSRASVHNVSIVKELQLGAGDTITVYKANMIIPQIAENLTKSGSPEIPNYCPACRKETVIKKEKDVETLYCTNSDCPAKAVKAFSLFVSRDALNIEGMSEATLEKFLSAGFLKRFSDLFTLANYREEIVAMEGFGEKSYAKLIGGIENASHTTLARVLYGLGIPGIGAANAKLLCRYFEDDIGRMTMASEEEIGAIDGIGPVLAGNWCGYFKKESNREHLAEVLKHLTLEKSGGGQAQSFEGKTFVVTGSVVHFANRGELREAIEARGGKVTGSVSAKTDYLINNDTASNSAKNKKARELGIPVISEEEFLALLK